MTDDKSSDDVEIESESTASEGEPTTEPKELDRRSFVKAAALGAAAAATTPGAAADVEFQPEEVWRDRMTPPDDGKKYGWLVDTRRCFGCHGCEVACKAENDVPLGHYIRQTVYHDFERAPGNVARIMVPMACQHCEDAPCLKACPCGALHKGAGGTVQVDYDSCSGHAACKDACPYGAIYIDPVANQAIKCHNCTHRVDVGMDPACVSTCPSDALYFGDLNDPNSKISKLQKQLEAEDKLQTLRPEKGTRPRMQFVVDEQRPLEEWESKIPKEGESYSPDAYSVYNWSDDDKKKGGV
ncbi:MAG: 4Fe-4S dicluster domain-containing protein [Planctomycetota bacterium]